MQIDIHLKQLMERIAIETLTVQVVTVTVAHAGLVDVIIKYVSTIIFQTLRIMVTIIKDSKSAQNLRVQYCEEVNRSISTPVHNSCQLNVWHRANK